MLPDLFNYPSPDDRIGMTKLINRKIITIPQAREIFAARTARATAFMKFWNANRWAGHLGLN